MSANRQELEGLIRSSHEFDDPFFNGRFLFWSEGNPGFLNSLRIREHEFCGLLRGEIDFLKAQFLRREVPV